MLNTVLFRFINAGSGYFGLLDVFMVFCAEYIIYILVFGVLIFLMRNHRRWRDMAIVAFGSAIIARLGVAEIIRALHYSPRPYWVLENVRLLLGKELQGSFPSGHTIFGFALATGVYLYNKKIGKWYFLLAGLMGIARIFVGVHWPYDIIGGVVLGIATTLVCNKYYRKYKYKFGL